jgi:hypothetical protein
MMLQLLDAQGLIGVLGWHGAAVRADERAGRLERRQIGSDRDLRCTEARREGLDGDAPIFAKQLADAPPAFLDQQAVLGWIQHQTGIASSTRKF